MFVRLILSVLCVGSAGALGMLKGERMRQRIQALGQLIRFLTHVVRELEFGREPLPEIFEKMALRNKKPLQDFLTQTAKDLQSDTAYISEIFSRNVKEYLTDWNLDRTDIRLLEQFGRELGYPDRQLQIHTVESYLQELELRKKELQKEYPKNSRLFRTLGLSAGVLAAVLLW